MADALRHASPVEAEAHRAGARIAVMKVKDLLDVIDRLAPFQLAQPWDNVGLQIGSREAPVSSIVVSLDLTAAALDEAAANAADVVLVHHPPLFSPLATLTDDTPAGELLLRAVRERRSVIACHTNLDAAHGGLADILAGVVGLQGTASFEPVPVEWLKLVGFVPADELENVAAAVFAAGAGVIGRYEHCSFRLHGTGTFKPLEGANPVVGTVGSDTVTGEVRFEAVLPRSRRREVLDAFVAAHSYEEPAYDVYPLENEVGSAGIGRVGDLRAPQPLGELAAAVAHHLRVPHLRFTGSPQQRVSRAAVVPGSGAVAIDSVAGRADVLLTGDVKYHDADRAARLGLPIIDLPHEVAEGVAMERWADTLGDALAESGVTVQPAGGQRSLWSWSEEAEAPQRLSVDDVRPSDAAKYYLFVDGGARGNPGPAGIGVRLETPDGEVVEELADAIGVATNNQAEYQALIAGLELALDRDAREILVHSDSELVVNQMNGSYRVKDKALQALFLRAQQLVRQLPDVEFRHVPREQNAEADRLVNQAIDAALKG